MLQSIIRRKDQKSIMVYTDKSKIRPTPFGLHLELLAIKGSFFALIILGQIGCKKFVQVDPPVTGLVSTVVYSDNKTAAAAVTSIYDNIIAGSGFASGNLSVSHLCGLSADELKNYSNDALNSTFYANSLTITSNSPTYWAEFYQYIYQANAVVEGVSASSNISSSIKRQLIGEAKFMRAFLHFYAVNLFGDIPLVLTTDYRVNNTLSRTPKDKVYDQIIIDLKDAQDSLSDDFLDPGGAVTTERVRPNKAAATALLARVYLYTSNWAKAETQSSSIIANTSKYGLVTELNNVFLKNSGEAIWQLQSIYPGANTWDGNDFVLTSAPGAGDFTVALSDNLQNAFEMGDNRSTNWVNSLTVGGETYYYPFKYKIGVIDATTKPTEYTMVFRLAEQYLIRAEARANQGNLSDAQSDINAIRNRAGLSNTAAATQPELLKAIQHERQVELFTEWGHRWLDLKRTDAVDSVMKVITPQKGGVAWDTNQQLYPIPQSERLINPHLSQNPGY